MKKNLGSNHEGRYVGEGFIATKEGAKYFIEYQKAAHGGGLRKIQVNKEVFDNAIRNEGSLSCLFKKYDLYVMDVPENDFPRNNSGIKRTLNYILWKVLYLLRD